MAESNLFRYLLLIGCFVCFGVSEDSRTIKLTVNDLPVYRHMVHVKKDSARIECQPPEEKSNPEKYTGFAIYKADVIICNQSTATPGGYCRWDQTTPLLSMVIFESGNYSCQYSKKQDHSVPEEKVLIYVPLPKGGEITVYEDGQVLRVQGGLLQVDNETNYVLECPGENADSKVTWYRNQHQMKFDHPNPHYDFNATTNQLIFKNKNAKTTDGSKYGGTYMCERFDKSGNLVARAFEVVQSGAYAAATLKSYNKMEGDTVTMSCEIDGEPVPKVSWVRKDKPLSTNPDDNKRFRFGANKAGIPNATMTIGNLSADDYGDYACVADGKDSRAEFTVTLRVRSKLAALWPFLGIVVEVIILVAIIFIYEKRRAKKEQEETEDTVDQKKSLTASNNENKDVRQRKA